MTSDPIERARALTPAWMLHIRSFDGLEIHPIRKYSTKGQPFCEPCNPADAHFWSVFGHFKRGGLDCFGDFDTEAEAHAFAERLYDAYPHLQRPPAED